MATNDGQARCKVCDILIFGSRAEAAAADAAYWMGYFSSQRLTPLPDSSVCCHVRFVPHLQGRHGELCVCCSGQAVALDPDLLAFYDHVYGGSYQVDPPPRGPVGSRGQYAKTKRKGGETAVYQSGPLSE